jgi:hypothetical protein
VSAASHFSPADFALAGGVHLDVALSGRVLAFEWDGGGVLFRAARQTVVRVRSREQDSRQLDLWTVPPTWPDDPDGVLAGRSERRPRGAGPVHIRLPGSPPANVELVDDAGYCELRGRLVAGCSGGMLAPV